MDVATVLKSIFAGCLCGSNDCANCYQMFGTDQCMSDACSLDEKRDLIEKIVPYLDNVKFDLGKLDDINVDELLRLFQTIK